MFAPSPARRAPCQRPHLPGPVAAGLVTAGLVTAGLVVACLVAASCAAPATPSTSVPGSLPERTPPAAATPAAAPPAASSASAPVPAADLGAGEPCGAHDCRRFADAQAALRYVLREQPLVLGLGEAHTPAGSEHLSTTAARFSEQLLPALAETASHLIVELLAPNPACKEAARPLERAQRPVVKAQARSNQSDYVTMGVRARSLGIEPFLLTPSCQELQAIADAGQDAIVETLSTIASITARMAKGALVRNLEARSQRLVLAYGGALHNDLSPSSTRASFRYGDVLQDFSAGRYVALDLIVRELIKDNEAWRALPWYAELDRELHPDSCLLLQPAPHSYVLFFPRTPAAAAAPR